MLKIICRILGICLILLFLYSCRKESGNTQPTDPEPQTSIPDAETVKSGLADKKASNETASLFYNLKKSSKTNILFGHQDDTKRGITYSSSGLMNWENEQDNLPLQLLRSDVKDVSGSYPAVYGHDFIHIANFQSGNWFDYEKSIAHDLCVDAYNRGGVNTFCWHYFNPVSKGSFYWNESPVEAVSSILPGGALHDVYKNSLKQIADFAKSLMGADGKLVPLIFRPFHEFDGDWFWWGKAHCTDEQYKQLYRFTVSYLRDDLGVHNFLYAWSPDRNFASEAQYLERYPGDEYVDLLGTDNYEDIKQESSVALLSAKLKIVSDYAIRKNKLAAFTETGLQNLTKSDWYSQVLLKALKNQKLELAYVMVWANTGNAFWTPYKGHPAEADFIRFKNDPYILFGDKLTDMYTIKSK